MQGVLTLDGAASAAGQNLAIPFNVSCLPLGGYIVKYS